MRDDGILVRLPIELLRDMARARMRPPPQLPPIQHLMQQAASMRRERLGRRVGAAKTERNASIMRMTREGITQAKIAEAHGISRTRVAQIVRRGRDEV